MNGVEVVSIIPLLLLLCVQLFTGSGSRFSGEEQEHHSWASGSEAKGRQVRPTSGASQRDTEPSCGKREKTDARL